MKSLLFDKDNIGKINCFKLKYLYKFIFEIFYAIIRYSGVGSLFKIFFAKNSVTIIVYHNPKARTFEKHLKYLLHHYKIISLSDLSLAIYQEEWEKLPKYPLLITIDDGWKENYDLLEIIEKYKIRPTIFLTSHLVNTYRNYWWTIVNNPKETKRLKKVSNSQRLMDLFDKFSYYPEMEFPENRQVLNLHEIEKMKEFVDFGLHSCFHPILTKCTEGEKKAEIIECKRMIEKLLDSNVNSFAYPNGDYDIESINILKETGIKIARTTDLGRNNRKTDPLMLKAIGVSDEASINKLASELTGIPLFFQYLMEGNIFWFKKKAVLR